MEVILPKPISGFKPVKLASIKKQLHPEDAAAVY